MAVMCDKMFPLINKIIFFYHEHKITDRSRIDVDRLQILAHYYYYNMHGRIGML